MERGSRKRSSSAGSEKMERVGGRYEKNGRRVFDRPKPTMGCSANGRRRRRYENGGTKCHSKFNTILIKTKYKLSAIICTWRRNSFH